ncbi:MAG TPA: MarR family transcriptional regulator [Candidatus Limnocylindrales bacterium]
MIADSLDRIAYSIVAITARAVQAVAGPELTFLGWRVLVVVDEMEAPARLGAVATRLGLSAPSASKLVRRLQRRGLVTLARDTADRRGLVIALTPEGRQIRTAVMRRRREVLEGATEPALPDDVDGAFHELARRLAQADA